MKESRYVREKNRKRSMLKKFLLFVALILIIFLSYGGYIAYKTYEAANNSYEELDRGGKSKLRKEAVTIGEDPISILLMGVENYSSGGSNGRTDTMIVVTINPKKKEMKMLSIPRDTRVKISGKGIMDKINHAHAYGSASDYGGVEMAVDTIENFTDIPIDYYVKIDFQGLVDIIDDIGGVTVNVPFDFWEKNIFNNGEKIYFQKGSTHLNGEEALAYVRMRKRDPHGDFGRSERQRQLIQVVVEKVTSAKTIFKIDEIAGHLGEHVQTNLNASEIYNLQKDYTSLSSLSIDSLTLDGEGEKIEGVYYFVPYDNSIIDIKKSLKQSLKLKSQVYDTNTRE